MAEPDLENEFEVEAREAARDSIVGEFWSFLKDNKKWWLLPIIIVMALIGAMLVINATGVGPFLYTFF